MAALLSAPGPGVCGSRCRASPRRARSRPSARGSSASSTRTKGGESWYRAVAGAAGASATRARRRSHGCPAADNNGADLQPVHIARSGQRVSSGGRLGAFSAAVRDADSSRVDSGCCRSSAASISLTFASFLPRRFGGQSFVSSLKGLCFIVPTLAPVREVPRAGAAASTDHKSYRHATRCLARTGRVPRLWPPIRSIAVRRESNA